MSSQQWSDSPGEDAAPPDGVATATVPEPEPILSPGRWGENVFNPIVKAEFRRWRARPITYLSIVLVTLSSIVMLYYMRTNRLSDLVTGLDVFGFDLGAFLSGQQFRVAGAAGGGSRGWIFAYSLMAYVIRPSTIIPLLMTWRALASFRAGGMYRAFRMTFLTPGEFLWGVIATPFFVSALILVLYTGLVLAPDSMVRAYMRPPERGSMNQMLYFGGILFEGALNGMLICFIALLVGLVTNARLSALGLVALITVGIQAAQAWPVLKAGWIRDAVQSMSPEWQQRLDWTRGLETYLIWGTPKLILCVILWWVCVAVIRGRAEE